MIFNDTIDNKNVVHRTLPAKALLNIAIARGEGILAKNGAFSVITGHRTRRSRNLQSR